MKKTLTAVALLLASNSSMAAQMECMVDTDSLDTWQVSECTSFEYTLDRAVNNATWRIVNITKTISSVIWSERTTGCSSSATSCTKAIPPYSYHLGKATVLYTDGTYEILQATAQFETGF
ncbi:hypothetical protein [Rheinheimera hassiensis]|uniref:hypothetical protein n=1 Tax=Rheinheimera hassiensis TaxID=1193627 RepID=UPI001F0675B8|nr:hypothetical protein [Rheinheimera hassiensis]